MKFSATAIPDVVLIEPAVHGDNRGFFMETWRADLFAEAGIAQPFVQDNHSKSKFMTLRGLHYQTDRPQGKLVRVVEGEVFDVAVDLRRSSPTFGHWVGQRLSAANKKMLWVPPAFAHGFLVLSETAEFVYKCTDYYFPQLERSLSWDDDRVGIEWPLANEGPSLSEKDKNGRSLGEAETFE